MAVYLAAEAHGASELMAMCEHYMAMSLAKAERSEQWAELSDVVKERARSGHARLVAERAHMRELREVISKVPCILFTSPVAAKTPLQ